MWHTLFRLISFAWITLSLIISSSAYAQTPSSTSNAIQVEKSSSQKPSVISLSPAATELIYALGLEAHLQAVDQNSNFPEVVRQLPSVGDPFQPNAELLALYRPDWLIAYFEAKSLPTLRQQLGFQQWIMHPNSIDELLDDAERLLALLSPDQTPAFTKIQQWSSLWNKIQHSYPQSEETFFIYLDGSPMYTVGPDTFLSRGIQACGLRNTFEQQSLPSFIVSPEALFMHAPHKIIAGIHPGDSPTKKREIIQDTLQAIGLTLYPNQIVLVPADILFRPSVRFLEALPQICEQLHSIKKRERP